MIKIRTNPNKEFVKEFRKKLKDNSGYCPCRVTQSDDTKCMCKEFKEQVDRGETGECHCGLYFVANE